MSKSEEERARKERDAMLKELHDLRNSCAHMRSLLCLLGYDLGILKRGEDLPVNGRSTLLNEVVREAQRRLGFKVLSS